MSEKREELLEILKNLDSAANDLIIFKNKGMFRSNELLNGENSIEGFVNKVCLGDSRSARTCFSMLDAELVSDYSGKCSRRVSGNLLTDAILEMILMSENAFSNLAAQGIMDTTLYSAMQSELKVLERLNQISEEDFASIINVFCAPQRDSASLAANAVWSGTGVRNVPKDYLQRRVPLAGMPIKPLRSWDYGEFELTGNYFADEALGEMYKRFIITEDWSRLTESLWSFHATYGTGDFLRYRNFNFNGKLSPMPELKLDEYIEFAAGEGYSPDENYNIIIGNTIAFMRNESSEPMLIIGEHGSGKTRMILRLVEELPELRLVNVTNGYDRLAELFETLSAQPQKFLVFLDNFEKSMTKSIQKAMIPDNVLLVGCLECTNKVGCLECTNKNKDDEICSLFGVNVFLYNPPADILVVEDMIHKILKAKGVESKVNLTREQCDCYLKAHIRDGCHGKTVSLVSLIAFSNELQLAH